MTDGHLVPHRMGTRSSPWTDSCSWLGRAGCGPSLPSPGIVAHPCSHSLWLGTRASVSLSRMRNKDNEQSPKEAKKLNPSFWDFAFPLLQQAEKPVQLPWINPLLDGGLRHALSTSTGRKPPWNGMSLEGLSHTGVLCHCSPAGKNCLSFAHTLSPGWEKPTELPSASTALCPLQSLWISQGTSSLSPHHLRNPRG